MTEGGGQKQQTYPDEKLSGQNGFFFFKPLSYKHNNRNEKGSGQLSFCLFKGQFNAKHHTNTHVQHHKSQEKRHIKRGTNDVFMYNQLPATSCGIPY